MKKGKGIWKPHPSIEAAKKIADAFEVSLDQLVGEGINVVFDKQTLNRIKDILLLDEKKKHTLFDLIDTYIKDAETRKAYASQTEYFDYK